MKLIFLSIFFIVNAIFDRTAAQGGTFGRFQFNFKNLLSLPASSTQDNSRDNGGLDLAEDPPLSCPPKPQCPRNPANRYRADGSCNNLLDGSKGQAGRPHKRLMPAAYADGRGQPRRSVNGSPLPSARIISTGMQNSATRKSSKNSHMLVIFCQFVTHDITNTPTINRDGFGVDCRCRSRDPACFNIAVPSDDIQVREEAKICLPVVRSQPVPDANCQTHIRQQQNLITPYLDAGTVYGASEFQMGQLLNQSSPIGELKTGNLYPWGRSPENAPSLPLVTQVHHSLREIECPLDVHKPKEAPCFVAGDVRANENPALASLHTLFVRMHNNLVKGLNRVNPRWSKTRLINTARLIMSAVTQRIMYKEFLPEVLGPTYMKRYGLSTIDEGYWHGYDSSYDATTSTEFSTAALRFGHTLVTSPLSRQTNRWSNNGASMELKNNFFNSGPLLNTTFGGANSVLRGLCKDAAETPDTTFVNDLHNFLFAPSGRLGHDLLAINIQRARDHGIPGYNSYREFCGLKKATRFADFVEIPGTRRRQLRRLYSNRVDDVDLYIAGLSENPVRGGLFGPTFSCILSYQFRDIKKGDRLWHENGGEFAVFTPVQLQAIRSYTFSRLICDTTEDTRTIQPNPFRQTTIRGNQRRRCSSYPRLNYNAWRDYSSNPLNTDTQSEETAWFPARIENKTRTVPELLDYLLANRPDDVCKASLGFSERIINGNKQYQFICPPGSLRGTDFPNVDASKGVWSSWEDASTPGRNDDESRSSNHPCIEPIAMQVMTKNNHIPARETRQVFRTFSVTSGFVCLGEDQLNGHCLDYQVRYFCKKLRPVDGPVSDTLVWTRWISTSNPNRNPRGDVETLRNVVNRRGFCRNPVAIEARTVGDHIPAASSGNTFTRFSPRDGLLCLHRRQTTFTQPGVLQPFCRNFEVRYRCRINDPKACADINVGRRSNNIPLPNRFEEQRANLCNRFGTCCNAN